MLELTAQRLRTLLHYEPETGVFTRLSVPGKGRDKPGSVAGGIHGSGYRFIRVDNKMHASHRLVWIYTYGKWPAGQVDHINGVRDDNRLCNLRDVATNVNRQNRTSAAVSSVTGVLGVSRQRNKFRAQIGIDGRQVYIGMFNTIEEASAAYLERKRREHPGCTI